MLEWCHIIHYGDAHFGQNARSDEAAAAAHDHQVQLNLSASEELRNKANLLVFSGDLTDKGDVDRYKAFAKLVAGFATSATEYPILITPGNHDVALATIAPPIDPTIAASSDDDAQTKFEWLEELWSSFGSARLHFAGTSVPSGSVPVPWFGVNTALRCWDWVIRPARTRPAHVNDDYPLWQETPYAAQVDIPSVHPEVLRDLHAGLNELEPESFAIVAGHHHLTAAHWPSRDAAGDTGNLGTLADHLLTSSAYVAYLHGHIHYDSIDVLRRPTDASDPATPMIAICAPELKEGFNEIWILSQRSVEGRRPISMTVNTMGANAVGRLRQQRQVSLRLAAPAAGVSRSLERIASKFSGKNVFADDRKLKDFVSAEVSKHSLDSVLLLGHHSGFWLLKPSPPLGANRLSDTYEVGFPARP